MLYDYQERAHEDALQVLRAGGKALFTGPTGCGKGRIIKANHDALHDSGLTTVVPSTEIGLGIYEQLDHSLHLKFHPAIREYPAGKQQDAMEAAGVWTVMRLYNELMGGRLDPPKMLQFDEGHHSTAQTYEAIHALCGDCPAVAYTATGFRGTPEETAKLRAKWGEPRPILTLKQAVDRGVIARPDFKVWPLLNDETIKITNGEFETKAVESALKTVEDELCQRIRNTLCTVFDPEPGERGSSFCYLPTRATMLTCPGVASAKAMAEKLWRQFSIPTVLVTGDTCESGAGTKLTRQTAFSYVTGRQSILVQVNVVSEGVDLPIRVHVDTAPCMSPVRWMQRVGRGTRPIRDGEDPPLYICTNHNLARHMYQWAGVIPSAQVREAQQAWGPDFKPSRRMFARALGLEGFGKFTASQVPLVDGSFCGLYALQTPDGTHQYAVLLHPCRPEPLFFQRTNPHTGEIATKTLDNGQTVQYKVKDYGAWRKIATIPNAEGYVSTKPAPIRPKMLDWWRKPAPGRGAEWAGLDPAFVPNAREFQALPILVNTGIRFKLEDS